MAFTISTYFSILIDYYRKHLTKEEYLFIDIDIYIYLCIIKLDINVIKGGIYMKKNYFNEIRELAINNEVYQSVKEYSKYRNELITYYNVGELLEKAYQQDGEKIFKEFAKNLKKDLDLEFSVNDLKCMREFYLKNKDNPIEKIFNIKIEKNIIKESEI